jgi:hypothetical protein
MNMLDEPYFTVRVDRADAGHSCCIRLSMPHNQIENRNVKDKQKARQDGPRST